MILIFLMLSYAVINYAWTDNTYQYNIDIIGKSRKTYFAGGVGTSENPFIISEPVHMYNLGYLQNEGIFDAVPSNWTTYGFTQYYFKVGEITGYQALPDTFGNQIPIVIPTAINFASDYYQTIPPVGTEDHPFIGVFEGNNSVLANYIVDSNFYTGVELQDVGTFGYVGINTTIQNLFIKNPTILSNPSAAYDRSAYHVHNDNKKNVATGIVAGHIAGDELTSPNINNIYIATNGYTDTIPDPDVDYNAMISHSTNNAGNRTQYGFVGYTESNLGEIPGGPQDLKYNFDLNALDTEEFLIFAKQNYGSWYVNNTTTLLSSIITYKPGVSSGEVELAASYTLSTLKISQTQNGTTYNMYDYITGLYPAYRIGSESTGYYNIENIDLAGRLVLGYDSSTGIREFIFSTAPVFSPLTSGTFIPKNYPNVIILYVKPSTDPNDLGQITYTYVGAQGIVLLNPNQITLGASGTSHTLKTSESYVAVQKDPNTGVLNVVNPAVTTPDYYVFMIAAKNGNTRIQDIYFQYTPVDVNTDALSSIASMAFIYDVADGDDTYASGEFIGLPIPIGTILSSDGTPDPAQENNNITYFNYSYELTGAQHLDLVTKKLSYDVHNSYFDYELDFMNVSVDGTFISIFIVNIHHDNIYFKLGQNYIDADPLTPGVIDPFTYDILIVTIDLDGSNNLQATVDFIDYG